jgi:hypothetical protein
MMLRALEIRLEASFVTTRFRWTTVEELFVATTAVTTMTTTSTTSSATNAKNRRAALFPRLCVAALRSAA